MRTLIFLLTHQDHQATRIRVETWAQVVPREDILIIGDQPEEEFARISHPHKVRNIDPRRRTRDHQRELQSYTGACQAVCRWMAGQDFTHVFMAEYDLFPLRRDLTQLMHAHLLERDADVLAHELMRVDGTSSPSQLYHRALPGFEEYWRQISVRPEPGVVLSMLGTASFWTREAFDAMAAPDEPFPMYLEIYMPTMAHHLGYRLASFERGSEYIRAAGDRADEIPKALAEGAWFIHPIKTISAPVELPELVAGH